MLGYNKISFMEYKYNRDVHAMQSCEDPKEAKGGGHELRIYCFVSSCLVFFCTKVFSLLI